MILHSGEHRHINPNCEAVHVQLCQLFLRHKIMLQELFQDIQVSFCINSVYPLEIECIMTLDMYTLFHTVPQ